MPSWTVSLGPGLCELAHDISPSKDGLLVGYSLLKPQLSCVMDSVPPREHGPKRLPTKAEQHVQLTADAASIVTKSWA